MGFYYCMEMRLYLFSNITYIVCLNIDYGLYLDYNIIIVAEGLLLAIPHIETMSSYDQKTVTCLPSDHTYL